MMFSLQSKTRMRPTQHCRTKSPAVQRRDRLPNDIPNSIVELEIYLGNIQVQRRPSMYRIIPSHWLVVV